MAFKPLFYVYITFVLVNGDFGLLSTTVIMCVSHDNIYYLVYHVYYTYQNLGFHWILLKGWGEAQYAHNMTRQCHFTTHCFHKLQLKEEILANNSFKLLIAEKYGTEAIKYSYEQVVRSSISSSFVCNLESVVFCLLNEMLVTVSWYSCAFLNICSALYFFWNYQFLGNLTFIFKIRGEI